MATRKYLIDPESGNHEALGRLAQVRREILKMNSIITATSNQERKGRVSKYLTRLECGQRWDDLKRWTGGFSRNVVVNSVASFPDDYLVFSGYDLYWATDDRNPGYLCVQIHNQMGQDPAVAGNAFITNVPNTFQFNTQHINYIMIDLRTRELVISYKEKAMTILGSEYLLTRNPGKDGLSMDRAISIESTMDCIIQVHKVVWRKWVYHIFKHPTKYTPGVEYRDFAHYTIQNHPSNVFFHHSMIRRIQVEILNYTKKTLAELARSYNYSQEAAENVANTFWSEAIAQRINSVELKPNIGWKLYRIEKEDRCLTLKIPKFGSDGLYPIILYTHLDFPEFPKRLIHRLLLFRSTFDAITQLHISWNAAEVGANPSGKQIFEWIYAHKPERWRGEQPIPVRRNIQAEEEKARELREESEDSGAFDEERPPIEDSNIGVEYTKRNLKEEYRGDQN